MQVRGEQVANSKLTADQVKAIRQKRVEAIKQREELDQYINMRKIAEAHGVAKRTISDLLNGITWNHVEGAKDETN